MGNCSQLLPLAPLMRSFNSHVCGTEKTAALQALMHPVLLTHWVAAFPRTWQRSQS